MKCIGSLCPSSLDVINTPRYVMRAGIIPYSIDEYSGEVKLLLGIKYNGKYSDFGGGCKVSKNEKPFDCAFREFKEEAGNDIVLEQKNITHILISGKRQPYQTILMVKIDEMFEPEIPEGEMLGTRVVRASDMRYIRDDEIHSTLKGVLNQLDIALETMSEMTWRRRT